MKKNYLLTCLATIFLLINSSASAQVDTSYVYKTGTPFGTLDIRIRKSSTRYYYLQENKTFSFRESSPGVKTNTFRDMTSWNSSPYTQGNLREKNGNNDYFILNYRLLFPQGYQNGYDDGYPLIVMMHGAGERGNCWNNNCYHDDRSYNPNQNNPPAPTSSTSNLLNNDHNLLHGGKPHLDARNLAGTKLPHDPTLAQRAFPGFVLFPQTLNGWYGGTVQDAIRMIRLISKKYNIDEDRIYIHGLSNGGIAVLEAVKRAPWLFAAALPMSAPGDAGIIGQNQTANIAHIPFWFFQGGQDRAPTPSKTQGYVRKFTDAGAIVRYSMYPNLGHGVWNTAYNEKDFFSWMLSKSKANIHLFAGSSSICATTGQGVRMEVAKGFRAYQWQKNGANISGANGASYVATSTGTYRVRFSRVPSPSASEWNEWSDPVTVTVQNPAQPEIDQVGTVLLKDLNNYNYVHLHAGEEAARYYWYKNNVLQNLSGNMDDTTRFVRFAAGSCASGPCVGNGQYTLITKTADNCPSPRSKAKYVYFNNQAPVNIGAPTNFTGQALSSTSIRVNWNESSSNEGGFEVWRRKVNGSSYSKWEMRTLTSPNIKTFTDTGAEPSTTYHYKIRAVNNTGRSNYTPSASNAFLVVTTAGDNIAPTAPQNLVATTTGINTIKLTWKTSTDNIGIQQYRIYYGSQSRATGSDANTYTLTGLTLNTNYSFTVKAEDFDENLSSSSNTAAGNTYVEGLYYEHTTGAWSDLDQINWNATPEYTGHVDNITLSPRTQEDYFNFKFDGYLYITKNGTYQFRTNSSDGSRVELNNVVVVNNDGLHDNKTVTGPNQSLSTGAKRIVVKYFENNGVQTLILQYKGPDTNGAWVTIPASAFRSGNNSTMSTMLAMNEEESQPAEQPEDSELMMTVYPNPAPPEAFSVAIETTNEAPLLVKLMNFSGEEIFRKELTAGDARSGTEIRPSGGIREGIYILIVQQRDKIVTRRLSLRN